MNSRFCRVLGVSFFALITLSAVPSAWGQESADKKPADQAGSRNLDEKNAKEQNTGKPESGVSGFTLAFPQAEGTIELRPPRGVKITLKLTDSSKLIYETVGKQAKINVLYDPDYVPRPISVDLNGVSLQDALKIVAFESRTFWRPVTSDTIFVAADTPPKRHEFEQQIVKTFYFPNIAAPTDLQDIVNGVRTIVEVQRIQQMPGSQTITIRATPEQMAVTEKLLDDVNRARQKTGGEYKLDFKINESAGAKNVGSRVYSVLIEPRQVGKLRIGPRIPVQSRDKEMSYIDVGMNIDCQIRFESEHTVSLHLTIESSGVNTDEHGGADQIHGDPVIQQIRVETSVNLELGTPTIVTNFQDPVSQHNFQIEATAVRTKSKE